MSDISPTIHPEQIGAFGSEGRKERVMRYQVSRVIVLLAACLSAASTFGADRAERAQAAAQFVEDALRQEIDGTDEQREAMLDLALQQVANYAPALWQNGYVLDRKRWRKFDDPDELVAENARLTAYHHQRRDMADTIEGHMALANWCAKRRLMDQRCAHLLRVLQIDPDHAVARNQLGYQLIDGTWMTGQEIADARSHAREIADAMQRWRPELVAIRDAIGHRSLQRRQAAVEQLMAIDDPSAIEPVEAVFCGHDEETALLAIEMLANIKNAGAALALTRQGIFSPWEQVRYRAAQKLSARDLHTFVPELLGSMGTLIASRAEAYRTPTGRLVYRHAFAREGQEQNQLAVLDTEYLNVATAAGSSMARLQEVHAAQNALLRENAMAQQNLAIHEFNGRVCAVLSQVTDESISATPEEWWDWWSDYNEVYTEGEKPVRTYYDRDQVYFSEPTSGGGSTGSSGGGRSTKECLVAGTPVWTDAGPRAVEEIQVGDRVLSQDPNTGELAYKLVVRTTQREPGPLVKFEIRDELIRCSGGHPFWVAGEGWVKARHLQSEMRLHAVDGTQQIACIEQTGIEPTYNLIVADFHTYFVGEAKILSHDNTIREPTVALVPGLIEQ